MNSKPIIVMFEENEMNIASLYSLYAQNIPEKRDFWERLSNEEVGHAAQIGQEKSYEDAIIENKFSRMIIRNVMDFVLEEITKSQQGKIEHCKALGAALRIEQSMLEKKCFEIFTPTNKKVEDLFCELNKDTEKHVKALQKEMKKCKITFRELER